MTQITVEEILLYSPLNVGEKEIVPKFERKLVATTYFFVSRMKRFVVAIDGLRRVGKTILLKQLLNKFQSEGKNVFYFSFDKKEHQNIQTLEEVVKFFTKKDRNAFICLDEVGKIGDWSGVIKKYYDNSNATFFVSSSAALHIKKGIESLAGRMINYTLNPMQFNEFLELKEIKQKPTKFSFLEPECSTNFKEHLTEFLIKGSYPELYNIEDRAIIKEYIKNSTIEKMIFEDIPAVFKIANVSKLLQTFEYFSNYSGDFIHENSIASNISISEPTVNDYLLYLEQSHLIQRVYTQANFAKKIRKKKKGFVVSPSIYFNTTTAFSQGKLIETAVFDKLNQFKPFTYRDEQKHEVDFIIKNNNSFYPIEVKSSENISLSELSNLLYYLKKRKIKTGYVIYNGPYNCLLKENKTIHLIPLSTFLSADTIEF